MIRKALVTSLSLAVVAGLLFGRDAASYVSTALKRVGSGVRQSVPVEFQIERARDLVADLAPEVRRSMHVIAKEEIELDRLDAQIATAQDRAQVSRSEILRLESDLKSGDATLRYAGHTYTRGEVREDLGRRFARHKVADETLEHLVAMRDARARNLDAARQKLTAMISAQKKLETDIANLEAKRQLVEVAQASSDVVTLDDSQLARARTLIDDIHTRLDVAARLANADTTYPGEIPLEEASAENIEEQVTSYFAGEEAAPKGVAVAVSVARD